MLRKSCDILIVGGGLGGSAAALASAQAGYNVYLIEETDWLGGQISSQGVSALDENRFIESFSGTRSYYALREAIRDHYKNYVSPKIGADIPAPFNPGGAWVSRLCFEPQVGAEAVLRLLQPYIDSGHLTIMFRTRAVAATRKGERIDTVTCQSDDGTEIEFSPRYVLDATELGDLLPLADVEYVTGAEPRSVTGEPHGHPGDGDREWVQTFTYPFAIEYCPGEDHTITKPEQYEMFRDTQPFTLDVDYGEDVGFVTYGMFETTPGTYGPFWTYRRLIDASLFSPEHFPNDIAMINWPGNDFAGGNIIDKTPERQGELLEQAKQLSLSFLYWLQTEAPQDDGGRGYPEFKLRPDIMGTKDGLSKYPYIRESRRIRALSTVYEQDIARDCLPGPRAKHFADSVGIGHYPIDIHGRTPEQSAGAGETWPFQIPLGALIPVTVKNLLAANKNIGTTRLTNGAYRLHPIEWNIGESCGHLAAFCIEHDVEPKAVWQSDDRRRMFQRQLLTQGIPLYWAIDVPHTHPAFEAVQFLGVTGVLTDDADSGSETDDALRFRPDDPVTKDEAERWLSKVPLADFSWHRGLSRSVLAQQLYQALTRSAQG